MAADPTSAARPVPARSCRCSTPWRRATAGPGLGRRVSRLPADRVARTRHCCGSSLGLPLLIVLGWWWSRRAPRRNPVRTKELDDETKTGTNSTDDRGPRVGFAAWLCRLRASRSRSTSPTKPSGAEPKRSCRSSASGASRATTKKVLAVDGRQWKEGQSSAGIADKARALYGERYAEFLDRVQAYAYFPYVVAPRRGEFHRKERSRYGSKDCPAASIRAPASCSISSPTAITSRSAPTVSKTTSCYGNSKTANDLRVKWVRNTPTATRQWHDLKVRINGNEG